MTRKSRFVAAAAALALTGAGVVATTPAAQAHQHHGPPASHRSPHTSPKGHHHSPRLPLGVLASGLLTPLSSAVARDGTAYVTSSFAGQILRVRPGGDPQVIYTEPDGNEIEGLSVTGRTLTFLVSQSDSATGEHTGAWVKRLLPDGTVRTVADLYTYETTTNPDAGTTYGFRDNNPDCDALWPTDAIGAPPSYPGGVDTHPYASTTRHGWTYVADAGANDILAVSPTGHVSTVATLPGIGYTLTEDVVDGLGLDPCFVGRTYYFESVPTDIEAGRHGSFYVSSLPGGPEGPELGARGSVFTVNAYSHQVRQIASGFLGATGVAVSPRGTLYVSQMFGNEVSRVTFGSSGPQTSTLAQVPTPGAVEWTRWGVITTTDVLSGTDGSAPAAQLTNLGF